VTHRFDRTVFVLKTPLPKEEQLTPREAEEGLLPKEPLLPGERVLTAGSLELKRVIIDLESRPKAKDKPTALVAGARPQSVPDLESPSERRPRAGKG
jgi:membrane fusion protein, heavy metal efflux system